MTSNGVSLGATCRRLMLPVMAALWLCSHPQLALGAKSAPTPCSARVTAFAEALEPVFEAVADGHPARLPAAVRRARGWWATHGATLPDSAALVPAMRTMVREAAARHPRETARAAVSASIMALDQCPDAPGVAAQLMRLDVTGMAAWVRAHGMPLDFPRDAASAAEGLADNLRAHGHGVLADHLIADTRAALAVSASSTGGEAAANRLLDRVDEVEKVAH